MRHLQIKSWIAILLLATISVSAATIIGCRWQSPSENQNTPRLLLASYRADIGPLSEGEIRRVTFEMTNQGRRRLVVNEMDDDCKCGHPVRRTLLLAPNSTETWALDIDSNLESGQFKKSIRFTTSDPAQPQFKLQINGSAPETQIPQTEQSIDNQFKSVLVRPQHPTSKNRTD